MSRLCDRCMTRETRSAHDLYCDECEADVSVKVIRIPEYPCPRCPNVLACTSVGIVLCYGCRKDPADCDCK